MLACARTRTRRTLRPCTARFSLGCLSLLAALLVGAGCADASDSSEGSAGAREARVIRHVDGDTLWLSGPRLRLIGLDTPEVQPVTECYGREAAAFVRRVAPLGTRVRYRLGVERRDRYGRARRVGGCGGARAAPGSASLPGLLSDVTAPDAVRIACEVTGSGTALVLVHGAGSARWAFGLLRPHLESDFKVVALDRRGRGASSDSGGYSLEREVDDLVAVMSDAGDGALLFGHSYGALVAATAAPRLEGLPALVLYEPPMGGVLASAERVDGWERLIEAGERDRVVREFMSEVGGYSDAQIDELAATPVWEQRMEIVHTMPRELRAEQRHALDTEALAGLDVPVLMLVGSDSPAWAVRSTEAYADVLPRVTVRTLDGQGHGATSYAPELVAGEVRDFLQRGR